MIGNGSFFRLCRLVALLCWNAQHAGATNYYIHHGIGSDANDGTNESAPLKTLARASKLQLTAGDKVLLAAGQKFGGQLAFENAKGTSNNPVVISSYLTTAENGNGQAEVDAKGFVAGVCLKNCAYFEIANLKITANGGGMASSQMVKPDQRYGVLITATQPGEFSGFTLTNLAIGDIFFEEPGFIRNPADTKSANGTQSYGWGIKFLITDSSAVIRDIRVADCEIINVSHTGLQFHGPHFGFRNAGVTNVKLLHTGGPGVQMSGMCDGRFSGLDVNGSGSTNDTRNWKRGSGLWTWDCCNVLVEKSRFQNANGPGDSCGAHIDYNCRNVIIQKCFSANNAGGFCEILGNNYNCAYRYNISVNDGWRAKGANGAMQEGKTFWLSGYVGHKPQAGPFNTYFYNNTVFVRKDIVAKISISPTARGVLIANNIFYFEGDSKTVKGDQTRADASKPTQAVHDMVFKNNLYLHRKNWPVALSLQDQNPIIGDPAFQKTGGMNLEDYSPSNLKLVENRGMAITPIPHDEFGLLGGLKLDEDILGQPINGMPDLGAIETKR